MATGAHLDPVAALAALLAPLVGAAAAAAWVPHLTVLFVGMAGGALGLMSWHACSRRVAVFYVLGMGVAGWLFAAFAVNVAGAVWPPIGKAPHADLAAALAIGWVGHRWEHLARGAIARVRALIAPATTPKKGGKR